MCFTHCLSAISPGAESETLLWVDKYKPKTIRNIIGQQGEKSNVKKMLRWLQNWHGNQKAGKPKGGNHVRS
jgi:replication factor C subunit 1